MRVLHDNIADVATLSSSNTLASLPYNNLLSDRKSKVARSTGLSWSLVATFDATKFVNCVAFAFTNMTSTATMRVRGYASESATVGTTTPDFDVTAASCCPSLVDADRQDERGGLGVNSFGLGLHSYAVRWFTGGNVRKLAIDVTDSNNPSGYIEASRLIMGRYWQPEFNPDYNVQVALDDSSKSERNDAGDLLTDRGYMYKRISMQMSQMQATDRRRFTDLARIHGVHRPVFLSIFHDDAEKHRDQQYMIYGKFSKASAIIAPTFDRYTFPIEIEEI